MKTQVELVKQASGPAREDIPPARRDRLRRLLRSAKAALWPPESGRGDTRADDGVFQPPKY